jgi:hypothetical protein
MAMSKRKFYRTVVSIEILSEEPLGKDLDLEDLAYAIDQGPCVGHALRLKSKKISAKQAAKALYEFASEPSFFELSDEGADLCEFCGQDCFGKGGQGCDEAQAGGFKD